MGFSTQAGATQAGTAATSSLYLQGGGAVTSAVGAYYGAQASKAQASIADTNARLAELGAQAALLQGQSTVMRSRIATANVKGAQRTAFAANGVDASSASAARVLTSTDVIGEVDANTIEADAVRAAFGYRTQAMNYSNDAMLRRAGPSPLAAAGTSLLGSGQQVAASWYRFKQDGAFNSPSNASDPRDPVRGQRGYD